jgi:hypothetical protein
MKTKSGEAIMGQRARSKFQSDTSFWFIAAKESVCLNGKYYRQWERFDSSGQNWVFAGKALLPKPATQEEVIQAFLD